MNSDQSPKPKSKTRHRDRSDELPVSRGGWKIKERRSPAQNKPKQPGAKGPIRLDTAGEKASDHSERKLIIGAAPSLKTDHLALPKGRSAFSGSALRIALLLALGVITAAAIYKASAGYFEQWLGANLALDESSQTETNDLTDNARVIPSAISQDVSVSTIALPALEDEGQLLVYFRLREPASWPIEVTYETEAHTAEADTDFAPTKDTVTIDPGELLVEVSIPLVDDDVVEPPEMFWVNLSVDPEGSATIDPKLTATVLDDDS